MAIELEIVQTGKPQKLPPEVILGKELSFGTYDGKWRLNVGKVEGDDFVVFDPKKPGRGITIVAAPSKKDRIRVKLPIPTASYEVELMIKVVKRIAEYWDAILHVNGKDLMPAEVFAANEKGMKEYNESVIKEVSQNLIDGKSPSFGVFGALWPLFMGKEEAEAFIKDPKSFDNWITNLQLQDVYYSGVNLYNTPDGIIGVYTLTEGVRSVFPRKAEVPFGFAVAGKPVECSDFRLAIGKVDPEDSTKIERAGEIPYDTFLGKVPSEKISRYDAKCVIVEALTREEIEALL